MKKILLTLLSIFVLAPGYSIAQCSAVFSYFTLSTTPPVAVFSDSIPGGIGPLTYQWNFGDGSAIDTTTAPHHQFPALGAYSVCLTITDSTGCTDTRCDSVFISLPVPATIAYLYVDSSFIYNCTSPQNIDFFYYATSAGYSTGDSIKYEVRYGDGVDSIFYNLFPNNGIQGTFSHAYLNAGNYTAMFIVTGPDQTTDTAFAEMIHISSSCGNISGVVYNDINGNCLIDSLEWLGNIALEVYNGNQLVGWTTTDNSGHYSFNVPTGNTYDIHVISSNGIYGHFSPSCPPSGILTVSSIPSSGNDFGITCPPGFDLRGSISGWRFRPGFIASVCVYVYNQNCNSPSGQIDVTFPSDLTPLADTTGSGYIINGNTVSFTINSSELYWNFCIPVSVSTNAQIGDSLCIGMNITPTIGDTDPSNNTGTFCFAVSNSYDPNDKYVSPAGEGNEGFIRPNTDLTYTIRFQNTGNAEAINIFILDTLNANLNASSVKVIASSHDVSYSLLTGNIMRFSFDNINLADSNSNEPASHGYVTYVVKQLNSIAQLAQIKNTAAIYFDFNQPVITNTTLNTVDQFLSVPDVRNSSQINVFPNPANYSCLFSFDDKYLKTISISNILGEEIFNISASESYSLNTEKFAEGFYTIHVYDNHGQSSGRLMILH